MKRYKLHIDEKPASLVLKTMEDIYDATGGRHDEPHRHAYYTIIWALNGRGTHIIDFKKYDIDDDNVFFVSPGQVHQVKTDKRPVGKVLLFTEEFLINNGIQNDFINDIKLFNEIDDNPPLKIIGGKKRECLKLYEQMDKHFESENKYQYDILGAYLKLLLIEFSNSCELNPNTQDEETSRSIIREFKKILERNFREEHEVNFFAGKLSITPGYLNEVIKNRIRNTAKEFILGRIILEAKREAIFSDKSSKQIGYDLGFEDPSYFSKIFKKETGISFTAYRKEQNY